MKGWAKKMIWFCIVYGLMMLYNLHEALVYLMFDTGTLLGTETSWGWVLILFIPMFFLGDDDESKKYKFDGLSMLIFLVCLGFVCYFIFYVYSKTLYDYILMSLIGLCGIYFFYEGFKED